MVDQIDRFHDSEMVAAMLEKIASRATEAVVINADDQFLVDLAGRLASSVRVERYGVTDGVLAQSTRGLGYAKTTPTRMDPDVGLLIRRVTGREAELSATGLGVVTVGLPARGTHYAVDAATALATARAVLGDRLDVGAAVRAISAVPPVFGRGEIVTVNGRQVEFVLVQNPASFQLNVDSLEPGTEQILVAIGSDVRDPSYFWPVDTSSLARVRIASGSKAHDIALQLAYDGVLVDRVEPDLGRALDDFLALPDPARGLKTIIFSADSMRRTRAHLGLATNAPTGRTGSDSTGAHR
jgi:UDP-N-acetylmuramyl tripeptide synthase